MINMWRIIPIIFGVVAVIAIIGIIVLISTKVKDSGEARYKSRVAPNERAGKVAENVVNYHLRSLLHDDEYLLSNILIPLRNGDTTEIDAVMISRKGIFCIETKYWVGHIIGTDEDDYWYQKYDDPYKKDRKHRNPVNQNEAHCGNLEKVLRNQYDVENIVIFAALEDGLGIYSNYAFTLNQFTKYYQNLDDELDESDLGKIYETLSKFRATQEQLDEHRRKVQNKYNNQ